MKQEGKTESGIGIGGDSRIEIAVVVVVAVVARAAEVLSKMT